MGEEGIFTEGKETESRLNGVEDLRDFLYYIYNR